MLLPGPESLMGPCTASHCCCLHRHTLPCATFRSPHTLLNFFDIGCWQITGLPIAAARPLICHRPLYTASHSSHAAVRLLILRSRSRVSHGSCTASHCCCASIATHSLPCAT
ncbi:unnamed protein product, partial [Staurois parvus]